MSKMTPERRARRKLVRRVIDAAWRLGASPYIALVELSLELASPKEGQRFRTLQTRCPACRGGRPKKFGPGVLSTQGAEHFADGWWCRVCRPRSSDARKGRCGVLGHTRSGKRHPAVELSIP